MLLCWMTCALCRLTHPCSSCSEESLEGTDAFKFVQSARRVCDAVHLSWSPGGCSPQRCGVAPMATSWRATNRYQDYTGELTAPVCRVDSSCDLHPQPTRLACLTVPAILVFQAVNTAEPYGQHRAADRLVSTIGQHDSALFTSHTESPNPGSRRGRTETWSWWVEVTRSARASLGPPPSMAGTTVGRLPL